METRESVCLLCPLGCPIGFNISRLSTGPEFPSRVCARGIFGSELLKHDQRIATPLVRSQSVLREASWDAAIERLASGISSAVKEGGPDSVAIVTEPGRSTQELEAVARLADAIGTRSVACAFEPQDWPLVTAIESGPLSAVEEASCVLVIGDVFSTHPVIARTIIDAKYTARGNNLLVLDPRRSNTAWYASTHLQNRPGSEALVLAAILAALHPGTDVTGEAPWLKDIDSVAFAAAAGIDPGDIARAAHAFAAAEKGAIVLAPPTRGVSDVALTAALAGLIVKAGGKGKGLVALPSEGNAAGAADVARRHAWLDVSRVREGLESGEYKALLCIGTDIASAYPSAALSRSLEKLSFVGTVSLFHGETEAVADVVLAGTTWLEDDGEIRLFDGSTAAWKAVVSPSWAALPLGPIVDRITAALPATSNTASARNASAPAAVTIGERLERVRKSLSSSNDLSLVTIGASGHSGAGTVTRWVQWARDMFPHGFVELGEGQAAAMGITDGEQVTVTGDSGSAQCVVRVTDRLEDGVAAVASYDPAARALFDWSAQDDGWFATGPGHVTVKRLQS
ncbi:MAG: molybdopterin oxidoreductase family protein [Chloroflexota bacterium]